MKKQLFLSLVAASAMVLLPSAMDAKGSKPRNTVKGENMAKDYLDREATPNERKIIANLKLANKADSLEANMYTFVPRKSHEYKMLEKYPMNVQKYLTKKLPNICWEGKEFNLMIVPQKSASPRINMGVNQQGQESIIIHGIKMNVISDNKPTKQDIENFNACPKKMVEDVE